LNKPEPDAGAVVEAGAWLDALAGVWLNKLGPGAVVVFADGAWLAVVWLNKLETVAVVAAGAELVVEAPPRPENIPEVEAGRGVDEAAVVALGPNKPPGAGAGVVVCVAGAVLAVEKENPAAACDAGAVLEVVPAPVLAGVLKSPPPAAEVPPKPENIPPAGLGWVESAGFVLKRFEEGGCVVFPNIELAWPEPGGGPAGVVEFKIDENGLLVAGVVEPAGAVEEAPCVDGNKLLPDVLGWLNRPPAGLLAGVDDPPNPPILKPPPKGELAAGVPPPVLAELEAGPPNSPPVAGALPVLAPPLKRPDVVAPEVAGWLKIPPGWELPVLAAPKGFVPGVVAPPPPNRFLGLDEVPEPNNAPAGGVPILPNRPPGVGFGLPSPAAFPNRLLPLIL